MRREDCVEMFGRIPPKDHSYVNLVMRNQSVISVDQVARFEPAYIALRGREGGTTDEGRVFFIPYEEIAYIRIERLLRLRDLKVMFGDMDFVDPEDRLSEEAAAESVSTMDTPMPMPAVLTDPASIARQNLLDRIRAARTAAGSATGRLDKR